MAGEQRFKRPESVLIVVFTEAGEVLLLKRRDHPDFWQSVTGSLRWGESAPAAACRELREETGLEAGRALVDRQRQVNFEIIETWRHRYAPGVRHNREYLFSLALSERRPVRIDPREHVAYTWCPRAEAADKVWSWSNRDAILDCVRAPARPY